MIMDDFKEELQKMTIEELREALEEDPEVYSNEELGMIRTELLSRQTAGKPLFREGASFNPLSPEYDNEETRAVKEHAVLTTCDGTGFFRVETVYGIVSGECSFLPNPEDCEQQLADARAEALKRLEKRCLEVGGNAVIGVRIRYNTIGAMAVVTADGTAVDI